MAASTKRCGGAGGTNDHKQPGVTTFAYAATLQRWLPSTFGSALAAVLKVTGPRQSSVEAKMRWVKVGCLASSGRSDDPCRIITIHEGEV